MRQLGLVGRQPDSSHSDRAGRDRGHGGSTGVPAVKVAAAKNLFDAELLCSNGRDARQTERDGLDPGQTRKGVNSSLHVGPDCQWQKIDVLDVAGRTNKINFVLLSQIFIKDSSQKA
jgi:hypothetical protein